MIITIKSSVKSLAKKGNTGLSVWYLVKKMLELLDMTRKKSSFGMIRGSPCQDGVVWDHVGFLDLLLCSSHAWANLLLLSLSLAHFPPIYSCRKEWESKRTRWGWWIPLSGQEHCGIENASLAGVFPSCHAVKPAFIALWRVCSPRLPTLMIWAPPCSSACSFWRRSISLKFTFGPSIPIDRSCLIFSCATDSCELSQKYSKVKITMYCWN